MNEAALTKSQFVVLPDLDDVKGRPFLRLAPVDSDLSSDSECHFLRDKSNSRMKVACVYEVEHDDKSYRLAAAVYVSVYRNEERASIWQAQQKARDIEADRIAREKRETGKTNRLEARLEPLRVAYQSLPAPQRLGFELWVLSVLRRKS